MPVFLRVMAITLALLVAPSLAYAECFPAARVLSALAAQQDHKVSILNEADRVNMWDEMNKLPPVTEHPVPPRIMLVVVDKIHFSIVFGDGQGLCIIFVEPDAPLRPIFLRYFGRGA